MVNILEILDLAKNKAVDQAEVFYQKNKILKVSVMNGKLEDSDEVEDRGLGIRIIKGQKQGFAYTSDFDETVIETIIDQAIANASNSEADQYLSLPEKPGAINYNLSGLYDPAIKQTSIKDKIDLALMIESAAYQTDKRVKKTEKISYSDSEREIWIVNSNGINAKYKSNSCGAMAQVIAGHDGEMEYGAGLDFVKQFTNLDPLKIGQEAACKACELLSAKHLKSQKLPVILDPEVGTELLEVLLSPLTAEAVQKGKSLFVAKIGQSVGAEKLTIIDNGRLENAVGSSPFDDEGAPTQETKLIENGVLKNYLYNTYTAKKGQTKSTGNASRGSFMTLPGTGATNLYIQPGKNSANSIIKSIKKGLYITRVMGIHTANPISGDFSIGASGIMIEAGKKTYAVRGITIAGNLVELLSQIEEVGSDLRFFGNVGSPSLLISNISVSGA